MPEPTSPATDFAAMIAALDYWQDLTETEDAEDALERIHVWGEVDDTPELFNLFVQMAEYTRTRVASESYESAGAFMLTLECPRIADAESIRAESAAVDAQVVGLVDAIAEASKSPGFLSIQSIRKTGMPILDEYGTADSTGSKSRWVSTIEIDWPGVRA